MRKLKPIRERLDANKYVKGDCWGWLGWANRGRPQTFYNGRDVFVTRLIMHLEKGFDLDSELQVNHKSECQLRPQCWNPEHLYIGTQQDNMTDKFTDITHCRWGHEYSDANTRWHNGARHCRKCDNISRDSQGQRIRG